MISFNLDIKSLEAHKDWFGGLLSKYQISQRGVVAGIKKDFVISCFFYLIGNNLNHLNFSDGYLKDYKITGL